MDTSNINHIEKKQVNGMADHEALAEEISINLNTLMNLAYSCIKYFDDETEYNIFELCNLYFRYGGSSFSMARVISSISSNFNTQQELDEVRNAWFDWLTQRCQRSHLHAKPSHWRYVRRISRKEVGRGYLGIYTGRILGRGSEKFETFKIWSRNCHEHPVTTTRYLQDWCSGGSMQGYNRRVPP